MERAFIRIQSTDHTDILINPVRITSVEETKSGCNIHFDGSNYIKTTASFQSVCDAIERSIICR